MINLEPGLVVVLAATLIFYLRLIILQRERVKHSARALAEAQRVNAKKKGARIRPKPSPSYSVLSQRRSDWIIAGSGILLILAGILLNRGLMPVTGIQSFWWLPTSIGIVAFSWAFRL